MLNIQINVNYLKISVIKLSLFVLLLCISNISSAETLIGEAKYKGKIVYTETHEITYLKYMLKSISTEYVNKDIKIGSREIDFPENHYMPNLTFSDFISDDMYSLEIQGLKGTLKSKIDGTEKVTEFDIEDNMVITDSIFKYVYDNFSFLMSEPRILKCLLPKTHKFVNIIVKSEKSKNRDEAVFSLKPKATFLSWFTSKTYIVFNIQTKSWVKYIGPSNLKNKKGKILKVEIDYE